MNYHSLGVLGGLARARTNYIPETALDSAVMTHHSLDVLGVLARDLTN